ncbi:MAG: hypothetical protein ABIW33_05250 [Sphingomicrobium sp.]
MAKRATGKSKASSAKGGKANSSKRSAGTGRSTAIARIASPAKPDKDGMTETFTRLLQSPLVADLVAVAATAALAALAEHGFSTRGGEAKSSAKRAGKAVREAGKAAAAAVGRRLTNEIDEIKKATKAGAKA